LVISLNFEVVNEIKWDVWCRDQDQTET